MTRFVLARIRYLQKKVSKEQLQMEALFFVAEKLPPGILYSHLCNVGIWNKNEHACFASFTP